jgi:N,N'-diacetyllegionaminate synthase
MIICAEIGINHNGDMNLCHELIRQAAINGADLVKFQLYDPKILFADEPHLIEEGERCSISYDNFKQILDWCAEEDIEPLFSVFDDSRLTWTEDHGINKYKIASRTIVKTPEFAETIASIGKPVYAALGMSTLEYATNLLGKYNNVQLLYCVSNYPASYESYKQQPKDYGDSPYYGISDHTIGIETSLVAAGRGAKFIEKHFTLSKTMEGSDHKCSITPDELYDLKKYSKLMEKVV